jgi:hypothetical protein
MDDTNPTSTAKVLSRLAWNKGKTIGPKPPMRPGHVWAIRARLQLEKRTWDLAMFNLAIDSKRHGCDGQSFFEWISDCAEGLLNNASARWPPATMPRTYSAIEPEGGCFRKATRRGSATIPNCLPSQVSVLRSDLLTR